MFAVILVPNFRLQAALRFRPQMQTCPVAITGEDGVALEISSAAAASGVRAGMPGVQALARCPALTLLPRALAAERSAQATLIELAGSLSPEIEGTADGCATVDLHGAKIPEWPRWCETIVSRLAALELTGKVGVAPNPDLAFLAARRAESFLVVQAPAAFLAQLAVSEIEAPAHLQALLHDWGIHTLGQLTSLPRGELADRLGSDADRLWQRAAGRTERLLRLVRPVEEFAEAFDFEHEIETVEPLLFILRRFLDALTLRLDSAHRVAARLIFTLPLDDGSAHERAFTIPSPTADAEVLFRVLHTHLESLQLAAHPTGVRLLAEPAQPEHQQFRLFESALRDPNRFGETLARLAALVGVENVGIAEIENTHRPDSVRLVTPRFHQQQREPARTAPSRAIGLPLRRFRPPVPANVRVVRQTPVEVSSPLASGRVSDALGPYRASGGWWERERWGVEEWDVEIAGHGLYRLRRENQSWVIEGCYDAELR
jgi:protein ImuB